MVLGIVGVVGLCFYGLGLVAGILALVFGYQARGEIRRSSGALGGAAQATSGVVLGWVSVGLGVLAIVGIIVALIGSNNTTVGY